MAPLSYRFHLARRFSTSTGARSARLKRHELRQTSGEPTRMCGCGPPSSTVGWEAIPCRSTSPRFEPRGLSAGSEDITMCLAQQPLSVATTIGSVPATPSSTTTPSCLQDQSQGSPGSRLLNPSSDRCRTGVGSTCRAEARSRDHVGRRRPPDGDFLEQDIPDVAGSPVRPERIAL